MYTIILFAVLGCYCGIRMLGADRGERILAGFFLGLIGAAIGVLMAGLIATFVPSITVLDNETELVALKDNLSVEGSFFLGSGSFGEEMKYYYCVNTDWGYKVKSIDADRAYIRETTTEKPSKKVYGSVPTGQFASFALCLDDNKTVFCVPPGSVLKNHKIDLE